MDLKINLEFFLKYLLILSVFLGPIFYIYSFLSPIFPETYYSWFLTSQLRADVTTYAFLCFFPLFFVSFKFQETFSKDYVLLLGLIVSGFLCIYLSFAWLYVQYIVVIVVFGALSGVMTPIAFTYLKRYSPYKERSSINTLVGFIGLIIWFIISFIVLISYGVQNWRTSYLTLGIINICAAIPLVFAKIPESV